tara:strand:- start:23 stop:658 length:636 start_codon:yes stop_codon:yes gene_type:complete
MVEKNPIFLPLFTFPVMQVQLDLDLEKLTEFAFEMWNKNKKGVQYSNKGGWHSDFILKEKNEEFIGLKEEINHYLQMYHSQVFRGMKFKGKLQQILDSMWVNINKKHQYNEWHTHAGTTLSGVYYIKHDGSNEQGNIIFKNPNHPYITINHFPPKTVETWNSLTAGIFDMTPKPNMLLIFPAWLEHKVEMNSKNSSRISLSFNSIPRLEKK